MPRDPVVYSNEFSAADSGEQPASERDVGVPLFAPAQRWNCTLTETETNSAGFSCRFKP
jgi:hypothetical protein